MNRSTPWLLIVFSCVQLAYAQEAKITIAHGHTTVEAGILVTWAITSTAIAPFDIYIFKHDTTEPNS